MTSIDSGPVPVSAAEAGALALEVAKSFGELVAFYERAYKLTRDQAFAKAREDSDCYESHIRTTAPDQLSWPDIDYLAARSPEDAMKLWERVMQAARDELQSGYRMAKAIECPGSTCWDRARFLALRDELMEGWRPTNGVERQLVETLALAQSEHLRWLETLTTWTGLQHVTDEKLKEQGLWRGPTVTKAEAIEQAGAMVDRFHRLMMRTLRTLRDLRRYAPKVVVKNAAQVNVGEQQVNVARE